MKQDLTELKNKSAFICDMDGVIYHGNRIIPHVKEFMEWIEANNKKFLFLTNSSERSPRELAQKLGRMGLHVDEEHFYTSALATASFLESQCKGGSVYVIGEPGLTYALYEAGFSMNDVNPDYVVFGEGCQADTEGRKAHRHEQRPYSPLGGGHNSRLPRTYIVY